MTTLVEAREASYLRFKTEWGATTPFCFDNEDCGYDKGSVSWVRVSSKEIGGGQVSLGGVGLRKYDRQFEVSIQVFTPINQGKEESGTLSKAAADIFEGTAFSGLNFFDSRITEVPPDDKWDQTNVTIEGYYEEIK